MKREIALNILKDVKENYDRLAEEFSFSRKLTKDEFKKLPAYAKIGDKVLDFGCGNGCLVEAFQGKIIEYFGLDNSRKLIEIAKSKFPNQEFRIFDGIKIPFPDNFFDKVYCLAVLHHIPSHQLRLDFLKEIGRVLKANGRIILSVWYLWQKDTYWRLLFKAIGRSNLDFFDFFGVDKRFFHAFSKRELKSLAGKAGFKVEEVSILSRGGKNKNLAVVLKK